MHANNQGQTAAFGVCNSQRVVCPAEDKTCTAKRHGTVDAYKNHGCRCPLAKHRWSRYMKDYRLRRLRQQPAYIDATGTRRRIQALIANGWTTDLLGSRLDITGNAVSQLARRRLTHPRTAARVRALYEALADRRGPSDYNVTASMKRGWLPPIWWDDETIDLVGYSPNIPMRGEGDFYTDPVAIDRYLSGDHGIRLTRAEKHEAYQRLRAAGHSVTAAAARLRLSGSTARDYEAAMVAVDTHTASDGTGKAGAA